MRTLTALRQYRAGRHLSNGVGAIGAFAVARAAVLTGPLIGAMLYAPMEVAWVACGLGDLRVFVFAALLALAGLLQLYARLGFFD